ncbi:hypothetical protein ACQY0O_001212 [Thecaphora frezii]
MDQLNSFLNKASGGHQQGGEGNNNNDNNQGGGLGGLLNNSNNQGGGLGGLLNNALGGGAQGEQNEDGLDKAVDMFQERVLGQGDQSNESAIEQQKDEMISDGIRDQYKKFTGKDFPIADKS